MAMVDMFITSRQVEEIQGVQIDYWQQKQEVEVHLEDSESQEAAPVVGIGAAPKD
jgi:hypothetical protein